MVKKIVIGIGGLLVLLIVIGLFADPDTETASTTRPTTSGEQGSTTSAPTPPATTLQAAATTNPATAKPVKVDTGRMSDTEYSDFLGAHRELVDESLEFSDGIQACSVIGQTGDLAGFRTCVQESYSGLDEDVDFAIYTAIELIDDTAKQCQAALRSYSTVTRAYQATLALVFDVSNRLAFDEFDGAYGQLGPASTRYGKFSTNALTACEPS